MPTTELNISGTYKVRAVAHITDNCSRISNSSHLKSVPFLALYYHGKEKRISYLCNFVALLLRLIDMG